MNHIAQPFAASFAFTNNGIGLVTPDLTREQQLQRVRNGEGASILWVLGHLYDYRCMALEAMGEKVDRIYESKFSSAPATDGSDYPTLEELLKNWDTLAERLDRALEAQPSEAFVAADGEPTPLFQRMTFWTWHEASHMGSISTMRKELGLPSASEVVISRMRKARAEAEKNENEGS